MDNKTNENKTNQEKKNNELYEHFCDDHKSVVISSVDQKGKPNASYAPFVQDRQKNIYIYISTMAKHYHNLSGTGKVSLLFIEDESKTSKIFARRRLTYTCQATVLPKEGEVFEDISRSFDDKFGAQVKPYHQMEDFDIFKLQPLEGLWVIGFGAAYQINILDSGKHEVKHFSGKGGGHKFAHKIKAKSSS